MCRIYVSLASVGHIRLMWFSRRFASDVVTFPDGRRCQVPSGRPDGGQRAVRRAGRHTGQVLCHDADSPAGRGRIADTRSHPLWFFSLSLPPPPALLPITITTTPPPPRLFSLSLPPPPALLPVTTTPPALLLSTTTPSSSSPYHYHPLRLFSLPLPPPPALLPTTNTPRLARPPRVSWVYGRI